MEWLTRAWSRLPTASAPLRCAYASGSGSGPAFGATPGEKNQEAPWAESSGRITPRALGSWPPAPGPEPEGGVGAVGGAVGLRVVAITCVPPRTTPAGGRPRPAWPTQRVQGSTPCAASPTHEGCVASGPVGEGPLGMACGDTVRLPAECWWCPVCTVRPRGVFQRLRGPRVPEPLGGPGGGPCPVRERVSWSLGGSPPHTGGSSGARWSRPVRRVGLVPDPGVGRHAGASPVRGVRGPCWGVGRRDRPHGGGGEPPWGPGQ